MKRKTFTVLLLVIIFSVKAQNNTIVKWAFPVGDKIYSHPVLNENAVYFGCMDSVFYAVSANTGKKLWSFKSEAPIQSKALVYKDVVYFKSGNNAYALNKANGKQIWCFKSNKEPSGKIDLWDYHSGSPAIYQMSIYFGFQNGRLLGFDLKTGSIKQEFIKEDSSSIKSNIVIDGAELYFGDWNGKVYAFDINTGKKLWVHKTYEKRLYPTFGPVNSQIVINNGMLYLGGRNPEMKILDLKTGNVKWSYKQKEGGWISGDPLVFDNVLYIGGSDNHEMFAFDATTGEKLWAYLFLNNNFSKPLVYKDYLIFTTGDAYNVWGSKPGRGYLYALDRKNGKIAKFDYIGGNIYSGIELEDDVLYFGSSDKNFYAVDLKAFLNDRTNLKRKGYNAFDSLKVTPSPFEVNTEINYTVYYKTDLKIRIKNLKEEEVTVLYTGKENPGEHSIQWNGKNAEGEIVEDGYYFAEITATDFVKKIFVQKKKINHDK